MQQSQTLRYLPALGIFAKPINILLGFSVEQWAESKIAALPWDWISACFGAFVAGQLVADLANRNSWIRTRLSQRGRLFSVEHVWPPSTPEELQLRLKVRALRKT